jgi:hypothetical protein
LFHDTFRLQCQETQEILSDKFVEPENRMAIIGPRQFPDYIHKLSYSSGTSSIFTANEKVSPLFYGYMSEEHLKEIVKLKAARLEESGILKHIFERSKLSTRTESNSESFPQVLTLPHLEAGFVIFCVMSGVSIVAFLGEFAWIRCKQMAKDVATACVVMKLVKVRSKLNEAF